MAAPPPEEVAYQEAHSFEDETGSLTAFYVVCIVITVLCIGSRIASRLLTRVKLGPDDWTFLVGAVIAEGSFIVLLIYAVDAGLGRHWLTLTAEQQALFQKLNYAYNILNPTCYPLIKISILLLYIRIFTTRKFRLVAWGCVVFVAMIGISNPLVSIFACNPIEGFYDPSVPARCIDEVSFYWANASLNVITDVMILLLPLPVLWRLQMPLARKIGISLLFMAGGLTFVLSILRIVYYLRINPNDVSYSFIGSAYSTPAEVTVAIICACAPTWRPLSQRIVEITRSRFSSLGSSQTYVGVEGKGSSGNSKSQDSQSTRYGQDSSADLVPTPSPYHGQNNSIYEAKHEGLPESQADAYTEQASRDGDDAATKLPLHGIKVKHEVKVEQNGNRV